MPPKKVLILGGTREAAELAKSLNDSGDWHVTTSLAGRTKTPLPLAGETRIGGFGGPDGLAAFIRENGFDKVIDATHPFAKTISSNAVAACQTAGVPLEIRQRAPWKMQVGDHWTVVESLKEAAALLPSGSRVFLALGRQYLDEFRKRPDCHFVIRMVDRPEGDMGFASHELVLGKPSANRVAEQSLFEEFRITHLVCRNSGGMSGYAKIEAARKLALPVVILNNTADQ